MGACNIQQIITGKTLKEAYASAVEEAVFQQGHDSYNGTISTTQGARLTYLPAGAKFTKKALAKWIDQETERAEKWGPVHALELPRSQAVKHGVQVKRGHKAWLVVGWAAE